MTGRRRPPPKVAAAADAVRAMIAGGELKPGDRAVTARALAQAAGVSETYARLALRLLVREGTLARNPGPRGLGRPTVAGRRD